jgi:ubiquinone biosynthesis protein
MEVFFMSYSSENSQLEKEILEFRKKGHRTRFYTVYFFVIKWSFRFLWFYKVRTLWLESHSKQKLEDSLFLQLSFESRTLFLRLGGVYIKVGQFISNLAHMLPASFLENLKDLQDRVPPHSFTEVKQRFFNEFNKNIEEVFPDLDRVPLASASTAQVHRATYQGKKVVIKILYPNIENLVEKDLKTVYFVMKWIHNYLYKFEYSKIHSEISIIIRREMNLKEEALSLQKMTELFKNEKDYVFPTVYEDFTKQGILVTKYIEGVKITETRINHKKNGKPSRPLLLLIRAYILMVFQFKFFHADPHPGNLIYTPQGKLCFIDFGAVSDLPTNIVQSLKRIVQSAISNDYYGVVEGLDSMGLLDKSANKEKLEQISQFAIEKLKSFITNTDYFRNISIEQLEPQEVYIFLDGINTSLNELMQVTQLPTNYIMLQRVLGLLIGTTAVLDPYRTIFEYAEEPFYKIVESNKKEVLQTIKEEGSDIALATLTLPLELQKVLIALNRGRIRFINRDLERHTEKMYVLGVNLIQTIFVVSGIHFGNFYLLQNNQIVSTGFFIFSFVISMSVLRSILKNKPTGLDS